jgi:hypothetical protein
MNTLSQAGFVTPAKERLHRRLRPARQAISIRCATDLGSFFAFAVLCILSIRANAAFAVGAERPVQNGVGPGALVIFSVLMLIAFGGWCRARAALKRAVATLRDVESDWGRRCAAVEAREQTARAPEDMLAPAHDESHSIVFDENLIDLRELIDGVVALFSPGAVQNGVHLVVSVDQSVAAYIVADSARLGQIVFHLVGHAVQSTEHGQITVDARAEPLNNGSQRILISVTDVSVPPMPMIQAQLPWLFAGGTSMDESHGDGGSDFALCERLAQHMGGELTVDQDAGLGTCSMFSAPFAVAHGHAATETAGLDDGVPQVNVLARPAAGPANNLSELFDHNYLDALSNEGIHLPTFLFSWRQSMGDDLERLRGLRAARDVAGLRASLHRLSGAVGLVGAHGLMEALRRASLIQPEPEGPAVDALVKRSETLMMQLDEAIDSHRGDSQ